jgi:hypothetical protein
MNIKCHCTLNQTTKQIKINGWILLFKPKLSFNFYPKKPRGYSKNPNYEILPAILHIDTTNSKILK